MKPGELYCKRKTEFALQLLVTASLSMVCFLEFGLMSANTDQKVNSIFEK